MFLFFKNFGCLYDQLTETILICFIADEEMFTGRHRFAEDDMRKFMDLFGQESDDVRNMATTKVNPFKIDKNNEVVKYEPMIPLNNNNNNPLNKTGENNFMKFLKINDLEPESGEKLRKIEKVYDPINNTFKVHAQLIQKNEEDGEMEKSVKSLNTNNEKSKEETPVISKPGSQSILPMPPIQQSRLATPQTEKVVINSKNNSQPASQMIPMQQSRLATPQTEKVMINSKNNSQPASQMIPMQKSRLATPQTEKVVINSKNNSRPTSKQIDMTEFFANNQQRPNSNSQNLNMSKNNENLPNSSIITGAQKNNQNLNSSKNEMKLEDFSRPGSSNKNDVLNTSGNIKDRSFVEIKKLEIEDLENNSNASYENEEEEEKKGDQKMLNLSKDNEKKTEAFKFKNEEKSNKFLDSFNNQFNLDQNRMKNNNAIGKSTLNKDNPYHF